MTDEQNPQPTTETPETTETPVEPAAEVTTEVAVEEIPADVKPKELPYHELRSGMTVRLHERISDVSPKGEKRERIQVFEGIILNIRGSQHHRTLTIRKISNGVGVEKIFPLSSPNVVKIEVIKFAKTRRNALTFLRSFKRKLKETWVK